MSLIASDITVTGFFGVTGLDIVRPMLTLRGRETVDEVLAKAEARYGKMGPGTPADHPGRHICVCFAPWGNITIEVGWTLKEYAQHVADGKMIGWRWAEAWFKQILQALSLRGYHVESIALDIESARADTWGRDTERVLYAYDHDTPGLPEIDVEAMRSTLDEWPPNNDARRAITTYNDWANNAELDVWADTFVKPANDLFGRVTATQYSACRRRKPILDRNGWAMINGNLYGNTECPVLYGTLERCKELLDSCKGRGANIVPWVTTTFAGEGVSEDEAIEVNTQIADYCINEIGCTQIHEWNRDYDGQRAADLKYKEVMRRAA